MIQTNEMQKKKLKYTNYLTELLTYFNLVKYKYKHTSKVLFKKKTFNGKTFEV